MLNGGALDPPGYRAIPEVEPILHNHPVSIVGPLTREGYARAQIDLFRPGQERRWGTVDQIIPAKCITLAIKR